MKRATFILFVAGIIGLGSCAKEKKKSGDGDPLPQVKGTRCLVLCEGNFQWNNADFDIYYEDSQKLYSNIFTKQNAGNVLGDVLQSAVVSDSLLWLVLNNSGKLVAVDPNTFVFKKEIKGLKSPRFMLPTGNGEAWVTDLYENHISILDLHNAKIKSQVACPAWTENLLISGSEIAVASAVGKLYWFDKSSGQLKDSTLLRTGSKWLQQDKNSDVWALASDSGKSVLYRINGATHTVQQALSFSTSAMKLAMNPGRDSLYFLAEGLFVMPINSGQIPSVPIFSESSFTYYGVAVNPKNGNVYVGNARDYVSKGEVVVLRSSGAMIRRFACGINPGDFVFLQ